MPPVQKHGDHLPRNLSLGQEHLQYLMPEKGFQLPQFQGRGYPEHGPAVETAACDWDMAMGLKPRKSPKVWMAITAPGRRFRSKIT